MHEHPSNNANAISIGLFAGLIEACTSVTNGIDLKHFATAALIAFVSGGLARLGGILIDRANAWFGRRKGRRK